MVLCGYYDEMIAMLLRSQTPLNCFTFHELQHVQRACF